MANSKIHLSWSQVPSTGQLITFYDSKLGITFTEEFKVSRLASNQVKIPLFIAGRDEVIIPGGGHGDPDSPEIIIPATVDHYKGYTAVNYKLAFNLDYNATNLFTVVSSNDGFEEGCGSVTITANYPGAVFSVISNNYVADIIITNESAATPITISNIAYSQAAIPCEQARVNVTTSVLATKVISPVSIVPNSSNPFLFDCQRGTTYNLVVENADGQQATQSITTPSILNANNFPISIVNSPNGATVSISPFDQIGLVIEYSLDGLTWQSGPTFSGLDVGSFILYVRDQLGCSFTKPFEVVEFGIYTPYFYISKSNSIRFANRIVWGDSANYKNDENTLGCEVDEEHAYCGRQNFKTANVITTQFKSNYKINTAKIIKSDLSEVDVPVIKMTNNIGIKDKRDARKYNLGNNKTGIYFTSGNIYNYDTNGIVGEHYLVGTLPEWAVIGGYIIIANAWYTIKDIFYDEDKSSDVIVISSLYTGADTSEIVGSVYNDFNYEVYEFTIDMVDYIDQTIQVRLNNDDDNFESVVHLSEKIDVAVNFEKNLEIKYWNNDNTDIYYASGIRNLINVELTKQEGVSEGESDTYKTDTNALLLSAQLYELDKFSFEPVTKEIWRKMMIALSHKNVFINGIQYVKNGEFETEPALNKSNLYLLKATMLKTGIVFNSDSSTGDDFNTGSLEIPGLIETEIGFVKY